MYKTVSPIVYSKWTGLSREKIRIMVRSGKLKTKVLMGTERIIIPSWRYKHYVRKCG